jgi:hypothetical protein
MDDLIMTDSEINVRDGIYVIERAGQTNVILGGKGLAEFLCDRGHEVEITIIDESIKPLDLLKKAVVGAQKECREVPDEVVRELIISHLEFVDIIIQSNSYEQAYAIWKNKIIISANHDKKSNNWH